jgi:hypothetical protein
LQHGVADGVNITDVQKLALYETILANKQVVRTSWDEFLDRAKRAHQIFLNVSEEYLKRSPSVPRAVTARGVADGATSSSNS